MGYVKTVVCVLVVFLAGCGVFLTTAGDVAPAQSAAADEGEGSPPAGDYAPAEPAEDYAPAGDSSGSGGGQPTAASASYQECDVFNGQVSFCHGWYQGKAVALEDGSYQECDIFNGQISFCHGWYQGKAVALKDGSYQECDIFNGQISFCHGWYQGKAVILTDR
jgi:hypothetical protein